VPVTEAPPGTGDINNAEVAVVVQPPAVVDAVYVVVTEGFAVTVKPLVELRPVDGVQVTAGGDCGNETVINALTFVEPVAVAHVVDVDPTFTEPINPGSEEATAVVVVGLPFC
jgi:hypothetical protein